MKRELVIIGLLSLLAPAAARGQAPAKTPPPQAAPAAPSPLQKTVEAYMRKLFAWGPNFQVTVGNPTEAPVPGFYQVNVEVSSGGQSDTGTVYVSKDGRFILRGDMHDTAKDPFAANRALITLEGNPWKGAAQPKVNIVEYSDFQCPSCRNLYKTLNEVLPNYPQVRVVYKDLPLDQIHPWAVTAAVAGRCAYQQSNESFWKMHDLFFENQDSIKPDNAWQKVFEFAGQVGLNADDFRACMLSPEAKAAVEKSVAEARALRIANTPTVFINGRRMVGGDRGQLEQFLDYELSRPTSQPAASPARLTPAGKAPPKAPATKKPPSP